MSEESQIKKKKEFVCGECEESHPIRDKVEIENADTVMCGGCLERLIDNRDVLYCRECDEIYFAHNLTFCNHLDDYICSRCISDQNYGRCNNCGEIYRHDFVHMCGGEQIRMREFSRSSKKFISSDKSDLGDIIQSPRKFGVELEIVHNSQKALRELSEIVESDFGFVHDGSIRGRGVEIVTPVMSCRVGEEGVKELLKKIRNKGCDVNESCGIHIHMDGKDFKNKVEIISSQVDKVEDIKKNGQRYVIKRRVLDDILNKTGVSDKRVFAVIHDSIQENELGVNFIDISGWLNADIELLYIDKTSIEVPNKSGVKKKVGCIGLHRPTKEELKKAKEVLHKANENGEWPRGIEEASLNEYHFLTNGGIPPIKVCNDDIFFQVRKRNNLEKLKTLLYLYTVYGDVFLSMLPYDRREFNQYCRKLSSSFSPLDIMRIQNYEDMESLWYKTNDWGEKESRKHNHYDDSRYHGLNLHSLFSDNGTVEVRLHGGTLDDRNILYWISLHQTILDKISMGEVKFSDISNGADLFSVESKTKFLLDTLKLRKALRLYVETRIRDFTAK